MDGKETLLYHCARGDLNKVKRSCQGSSLEEVLQKGLFNACHCGHLSIVQYLLTEQNYDPQCRDRRKWTPLHAACQNGHLNIVQYLLTEQNCDPQCRNERGQTPLHVACFNGHLNVVQYLLTEQNCDPQCRNETGWTPLHLACQSGHLNIVQYLLTEQNCDPQCRNETELTPLHVACGNGHLNIVQCLLTEQNCDPQCRDEARWTPLHVACGNGHLNTVQYLLTEQNCDSQCRNETELTPLHVACGSGHLNIVQYLLTEQNCDPQCRNETGWTPLHLACQSGHLNIVQYLLTEQNCDPQCRNETELTPLHVACGNGHLNIVQYLLTEQNCDPQCRNERGRTPLHVACASGHLNIVQYLLTEQNCDPQCRNESRWTPLHVACQNSHLNIVQYLLTEQNCDPLCRNETEWTPLHVACQNGHLNIVQYLLTEQNCDPQCRDEARWTPLHVACGSGHLNIVQYLLTEQNCDPQCRNETGRTPLHAACQNGHLNIVQYLLTEQNCDPQCRDETGRTPLHVACQNGHLNIVQYLLENTVEWPKDVLQCCLQAACREGDVDAVRYLVEVRNVSLLVEETAESETAESPPSIISTEVKELDFAECTVLHIACEHGQLDVVKYLTSKRYCDPQKRYKQGQTPLLVACKHGHLPIIQYLITEEHCNQGWQEQLLQSACKYGHWNIVLYLVTEQHCDPHQALRAACQHGLKDVIQYFVTEQHCETPLHVACESGHLGSVQYLYKELKCSPQCRDMNGWTPLHIACKQGSREVVEFLLSLDDVEVDAKDSSGNTPLSFTSSFEVMNLLLSHNADLSLAFHKHMEAVEVPEKPLPSFVKLYVIGNPSSGKSTLAKAIEDEYNNDNSANVMGVEAKTAGIVLSEFESEELGQVAIYDFAGHPEYYSSHSAVLENSLSSTAVIFLALVDLRSDQSDIIHYLHYWLSFIENQCVSVVARPHLVVIGSHLDECSNPEENLRTLEKTLETSEVLPAVHYAGFVALDCRKPASADMTCLRQLLKQSCSMLRPSSVEDLYYKIISAFLMDVFKGKLGLKLSVLTNIAKKTKFTSLRTPLKVFRICEQLNDRGHILFLPNHDEIEESWIVMDKANLLAEINGTLFAPPDFKEHHISSNTGVVPFSEIATLFKKFDPDLIVQCLIHLEFCQLINDPEILKNLKDDSDQLQPPAPPIKEKYLFFPSLVSIERPSLVWSEQEGFEYHCGWYLHCKHPHQFFTSRFLQVLLLRLAFLFVLPSPPEADEDTSPVKNRECSVWKNGVRWLDTNGIETVVEITGHQHGVLVMMRCLSGAELECVKLRAAIIHKVLKTKSVFCKKLVTVESLIHPSEVKQYPTKKTTELKQFKFSIIARAISENKWCVYDQSQTTLAKLDQLLYVEPYAKLSQDVLLELSKRANAKKMVPEDLLFHVSLKHPEILDVASEELTYEQLRKRLDEYSIFHGRDLSVRAWRQYPGSKHCIAWVTLLFIQMLWFV